MASKVSNRMQADWQWSNPSELSSLYHDMASILVSHGELCHRPLRAELVITFTKGGKLTFVSTSLRSSRQPLGFRWPTKEVIVCLNGP